MLAVIDAGLFKLSMPAFVILTGALAVYGYFRGSADFCSWLRKEPQLDPASLQYNLLKGFTPDEAQTIVGEPVGENEPAEIPHQTFEEIYEEIKGE